MTLCKEVNMTITVRVYGDLQRHTHGVGTFELEATPDMTVAGVMERLGVPENEVYTAVVNRQMAPRTTEVHEGDRVELVPPIGGG
jgi:sulfur carrier protein ThiS